LALACKVPGRGARCQSLAPTQEQVNQAADAILGTGKNPTVEKVRARLDTGSPNTVTRMLDVCRNQFGERLRRTSSLPGVPDSVGQTMIEL
jgi:ribosomal protein S14